MWLSADSPVLNRAGGVDDARAAIESVTAAGLDSTRQRMHHLLDTRPRPFDRTERPGHFTGSALVVHSDLEQILVLFHAKLQIWVQPGGHADGDGNLARVALREAIEETGIAELRIWSAAADVDIHRVVSAREDPHLHHDVRFVALAPSKAEVSANHESHDHRWVRRDELPDLGADAGLLRLANVGIELARSCA